MNASRGNKVQNGYFQFHWCHLKGFHMLTMQAKYESPTSYGLKVMAKVNVFSHVGQRSW